jgi:hypothetical protein
MASINTFAMRITGAVSSAVVHGFCIEKRFED